MRVSSPVPKKRARIEIIPLIDIMFFLLASFMMVSLSQTHMKGIRVNLPAAVGPPPSGVKDFVSVKVLEGNAVFFDNVYVPEDQVLPRLFELHRGNPGIKLSLSAAPTAMYGDVIGVLDKIGIPDQSRFWPWRFGPGSRHPTASGCAPATRSATTTGALIGRLKKLQVWQ